MTAAEAPASQNVAARASALMASALGLFHLANVAGVLVLSTMVVRAVHLTTVLALVYLARAAIGRRRDPAVSSWTLAFDIALACVAIVTGVYLLLRWDSIALSGGLTNGLDIVMASVIVLLVLEATRRAVGFFLGVITILFLLYPFVSPYLGGLFYGRGVRFETVVAFLALSGEGIYGIPIGVASTYIILFTIFGAFLSGFGAGDFFFDLSRSVTRNLRAASAKTAVLFSTMLGMISGSAAGNVAVTGAFTIPMMRREGYKAHQAAAIEAVVSAGGQLMPPVMGAAAFIMAEIVGVPYVTIMKVSVIPALLFFFSTFCVVHLQALKGDIGTPTRDERPKVGTWTLLGRGIPFLIPFIGLLSLMVAGYSPVKASAYAIAALVVLYAVFRRPDPRALVVMTFDALSTGARGVAAISVACAAAGIISGVLAMTGLGSKLSAFIISFSAGSLAIALVLTMLVAIVLGMGLPTTAAYLILATVIAPALADLGLPLLTAHLFVFFFGCVSPITPPVALASYVAAGIAQADINQVSWTAFRYGLVCYLLPFAFAVGPGLLGEGGVVAVAAAVAAAAAGVFLLSAAGVGYLLGPLGKWARLAVAAAGIALLYQHLWSDLVGIAVAAAVIAHMARKAAAVTETRGSSSETTSAES